MKSQQVFSGIMAQFPCSPWRPGWGRRHQTPPRAGHRLQQAPQNQGAAAQGKEETFWESRGIGITHKIPQGFELGTSKLPVPATRVIQPWILPGIQGQPQLGIPSQHLPTLPARNSL